MSNTKSTSLEELRAMHLRGDTQKPVDLAPSVELPDDFWANAEPTVRKAKQPISMRVDPDILAYFRSQGDGHLSKMHAVLRAYVDAKKMAR